MSGLSADQSAIRVTPEIQKALETAQFEDIKDIMAQAAIDQGLVVRDELNPTVLLEQPLAANAPKRFAKTVIINGTKHVLEAETELALARAENDLMRQVFATEPATTQQSRTADQPRDTNGRFVETLQEASSDIQNTRFMQSWEQSTTEFLNSADGASWPGGDANKEILGRILVEQSLVDAEDKTAALVAAYRFARENNMLVENPEVAAAKGLHERLASAQRPEDIRDILIAARGGSSGLFGR